MLVPVAKLQDEVNVKNPTMSFTGEALVRIRDAMDHAASDLQMQISSCPDVIEYADDLEVLEARRDEFLFQRNRINKKLQRGGWLV